MSNSLYHRGKRGVHPDMNAQVGTARTQQNSKFIRKISCCSQGRDSVSVGLEVRADGICLSHVHELWSTLELHSFSQGTARQRMSMRC